MKASDKLPVIGGLLVVVVFLAFVLFPLYELRDEVVVRRPLWNPPVTTLLDGTLDMAPEDIERLSKDPRQREILDGLRKPLVIRHSPNWISYSKRRTTPAPFPLRQRSMRLTPLLIAVIVSGLAYGGLLRYRGIV